MKNKNHSQIMREYRNCKKRIRIAKIVSAILGLVSFSSVLLIFGVVGSLDIGTITELEAITYLVISFASIIIACWLFTQIQEKQKAVIYKLNYLNAIIEQKKKERLERKERRNLIYDYTTSY